MEPEDRDGLPMVMLPYVAGVIKDIRRIWRKFDMKVVFKSGWTLRSMLTKVKDTLPVEKQSNVVYKIPYSCGWRLASPAAPCRHLGCRAHMKGTSPHQMGGDFEYSTRPGNLKSCC